MRHVVENHKARFSCLDRCLEEVISGSDLKSSRAVQRAQRIADATAQTCEVKLAG